MSMFQAAAAGVVGVAVVATLFDVPVSVGSNQVACFRTFGGYVDCGPLVQKQVADEAGVVRTVQGYQYYGPGLHMKWPWISGADKIQVSQRLTDLHTAKLTLGAQNQPAEVDYQIIVDVPKDGMFSKGKYVDSVYHLMYEMGEAGSVGVNDLVDRFLDAGLGKAFAPTEPDVLSVKRTEILADVTNQVSGDLGQLGVKVISELKAPRTELLGSWKAAANTRVESIGRRQAAENDAQAEKLKGTGKGDAILEVATKQAAATNAIKEADAAYIKSLRQAFGNDDNALAIFLMTKAGTALPQVLGAQGIQIIPSIGAARPAPTAALDAPAAQP